MPKIAGRKVRWALSTDGGTTYTSFAGSTSDGMTFTSEAIVATDKDDLAWQSIVDDVGLRSVEGTTTIFIEDTTIAALIMDAPTSFLHDLRLTVEGLFTVTGQYFFSSFAPTGAEGPEAASAEVTFMSSGVQTYAAAP